MRILYHAVNGTGLGHLMRTTAVAAHVRLLSAEIEQLIVTNASFSAHARNAGIPTVNLPPDDSSPLAALDRRLKTIPPRLMERFIEGIAREYAPDAVVFDTYVDAKLARRLADGRIAAVIFRESRQDYSRWCVDELFPPVDLVIVPHRHDEFFSGLSTDLVEVLRPGPKFRCVGPIVYPESLEDGEVQATLARYAIKADQKLVLIACGSGGYDFLARPFLQAAMRAALELRESSPGIRVLYVAGPYAALAHALDGVEMVPWETRFQHLLHRADVVIAHGGYNTVQEILRVGTPAILVPVPRKTEDQGRRLRELARRGRVTVMEPDSPVEQFRRAIAASLGELRPVPEPAEGGEGAAQAIIALLDGAERRVRVEWSEVPCLSPTIHTASVEVLLGHGNVSELESRARTSLEHLRELGLPAERTTLQFVDLEAGECLAGLVERLRDCTFKLLLACTPFTAGEDRRWLFAVLERCRAARPGFRYDLTSQEQHR